MTSEKYVVGAVFAFVFGYFLFGNTDVDFRSSDGKWADGEVQFKGRNFDLIVFNFETYKLNCHAPQATLVRVTPQYWINIYAWPSYLSDKKWRVPFSDAHPEIGNNYPPPGEQNCAYGLSKGDDKKVQANADRYLRQL